MNYTTARLINAPTVILTSFGPIRVFIGLIVHPRALPLGETDLLIWFVEEFLVFENDDGVTTKASTSARIIQTTRFTKAPY
jgi:hypothetical protein